MGQTENLIQAQFLGVWAGIAAAKSMDVWIAAQRCALSRVVVTSNTVLDEATAIAAGYRPCGVCLPKKYALWKADQIARSTQSAKSTSTAKHRQDTARLTVAQSDQTLAHKIAAADWQALEDTLGDDGYAVLPRLLTAKQCQETIALFSQTARFRSHIIMQRHAFGRGEYKYFCYPLPDLVNQLRTTLYPYLAPIANRWHQAIRLPKRFPDTHAQFLDICHQAGQQRPTPLLLRYRVGDYNCLHQDLYGEHVFPFQIVFLLSEPERDFTGGELLMTESNPKKAGRAEVVPLRQGDAAIFAVNYRPARSQRGFYRINQRHGVSKLLWGERHTLGIIFHDAQ